MKELALLFNVFVICHPVHSLGVHHCLLIPKINKNLALFTISKPELASNSSFPLQIWGKCWLWDYLNRIHVYILKGEFDLRDCEMSAPPSNALRGRMRVPSFFGKGRYFWGRLSWEGFPEKNPGKGGVFVYKKQQQQLWLTSIPRQGIYFLPEMRGSGSWGTSKGSP